MKTQLRCAVGIAVFLATGWQVGPRAQEPRAALERYIASHQRAIVSELVDLVSIPNTAADTENMRRHAVLLRDMLRRRGFSTEILETDSNPWSGES